MSQRDTILAVPASSGTGPFCACGVRVHMQYQLSSHVVWHVSGGGQRERGIGAPRVTVCSNQTLYGARIGGIRIIDDCN